MTYTFLVLAIEDLDDFIQSSLDIRRRVVCGVEGCSMMLSIFDASTRIVMHANWLSRNGTWFVAPLQQAIDRTNSYIGLV